MKESYIKSSLEPDEGDPNGLSKSETSKDPIFADKDREELFVNLDELWEKLRLAVYYSNYKVFYVLPYKVHPQQT